MKHIIVTTICLLICSCTYGTPNEEQTVIDAKIKSFKIKHEIKESALSCRNDFRCEFKNCTICHYIDENNDELHQFVCTSNGCWF